MRISRSGSSTIFGMGECTLVVHHTWGNWAFESFGVEGVAAVEEAMLEAVKAAVTA